MVIRQGKAMRVIIHDSEGGSCIDNVDTEVYESGVVNIKTPLEDITLHLSSCEIIWSFALEGGGGGEDDPTSSPSNPSDKVRAIRKGMKTPVTNGNPGDPPPSPASVLPNSVRGDRSP